MEDSPRREKQERTCHQQVRPCADRETGGLRARVIEAWSLRPDVLAAWNALIAAIASHMDVRRYELVTLVASSRVKCSV